MSRALVLLTIAALLGCDGADPSHPPPDQSQPIVTLPSGTTVTLPTDVHVEEERNGDRHAFRSDDGIVWSVQTLPTELPSQDERTLEAVAIALTQRLELGERVGEITHRACAFAGLAGQCIEGWQQGREGERVLRRGAVVDVAGEVIWISVTARDGAAGIDDLAETLARSTRIGGT